MDWYTTTSVPPLELEAALAQDLGTSDCSPLLKEPRCHLGIVVQYAAAPYDGTSISTFALNLIPTSRGTVTLNSNKVDEKPVIDPRHFETEADKFRLRSAMRLVSKLWSTTAGQEIVSGEDLPEGIKKLEEGSTDEEVDVRIWKFAE